jgi:hypothetical protein
MWPVEGQMSFIHIHGLGASHFCVFKCQGIHAPLGIDERHDKIGKWCYNLGWYIRKFEIERGSYIAGIYPSNSGHAIHCFQSPTLHN